MVDPIALLMQFVEDIDATMANAPFRGETETPVARMRRLEQWHDTVAMMLSAFKTNAEAAISGSKPEYGTDATDTTALSHEATPGAFEGGQKPGAIEINNSGTTPWRYSLHDLVLRVMGAKLNANQLNTLKMLDAGRTCAVIDCMGVQLRLRKDRSQNTVEPHRMPTSGDITVDIERFITTELPALTRRQTLQDFADDLFIYLQKRTWPDHLIWPAIDKTLTIFAQVQAGEIEPTGKTAEPSSSIPGVGRQYDEDNQNDGNPPRGSGTDDFIRFRD